MLDGRAASMRRAAKGGDDLDSARKEMER